MSLIFESNKIIFIGQVKDILNIFANYPPELTLQEFIRLNIH